MISADWTFLPLSLIMIYVLNCSVKKAFIVVSLLLNLPCIIYM